MKTTRPLSPVEMMIDRACGVSRSTGVIMVELQCRDCRNRNVIPAEECFPEGTALIVVTCENCGDGSGDDVEFFDRNGEKIA